MKNWEIPAITTDQMREVDRLMVEVYGITLIQMMENAGRNLAALARQLYLGGDPGGKHVLVLAGSGGNGGGGLVAARHLANWGADVQVFTTRIEEDMGGVPAHQFAILRQMGVPVHPVQRSDVFPDADLIVDAILGYSLTGAPRGTAADLIRMANKLPRGVTPVLSLDVPSGMDSTTGDVHEPHIRATATMTLALPKTGLVKDHARHAVGELYLADISVPPGLYRAFEIDLPPIFTEGEIIRIT
jgi:NAD(P)H-hydrate epimerase